MGDCKHGYLWCLERSGDMCEWCQKDLLRDLAEANKKLEAVGKLADKWVEISKNCHIIACSTSCMEKGIKNGAKSDVLESCSDDLREILNVKDEDKL